MDSIWLCGADGAKKGKGAAGLLIDKDKVYWFSSIARYNIFSVSNIVFSQKALVDSPDERANQPNQTFESETMERRMGDRPWSVGTCRFSSNPNLKTCAIIKSETNSMSFYHPRPFPPPFLHANQPIIGCPPPHPHPPWRCTIRISRFWNCIKENY